MTPTRTLRVVTIGPESTGKTTLARALADRFDAPWVPEAARQFAESRGELSVETVEPIARLAIDLATVAEASGPPLVFFDTDLVSTAVYARHYYGEVPAWIVAQARARRGDLYLLCLPDLPWVADGVRDRPAARTELLEDFRAALQDLGAAVTEVSASGDARTETALDAVQRFLRSQARGGALAP